MLKVLFSHYLLMPLFWGTAGVLLGAILLPFLRRIGISLIVCVAVLLWFFSISPVSNYLLAPLSKVSPMMTSQDRVDYLAVLGSGHAENAQQSAYLNLDKEGLNRLLRGIELLKDQDNARLWLGGCDRHYTKTSNSDMFYKAALDLGVEPQKILRSASTCNTRTEIQRLKQELPPGANIAIISSGFHLRRIAVWARHYELRPLYVPVGLREPQPVTNYILWLLPHIHDLGNSSWALREYFGMLHAWLLIRIDYWFGKDL